jgi:hypothetical protein
MLNASIITIASMAILFIRGAIAMLFHGAIANVFFGGPSFRLRGLHVMLCQKRTCSVRKLYLSSKDCAGGQVRNNVPGTGRLVSYRVLEYCTNRIGDNSLPHLL